MTKIEHPLCAISYPKESEETTYQFVDLHFNLTRTITGSTERYEGIILQKS